MSNNIFSGSYRPGMYSPKRTTGEQLTNNYFKELGDRLTQQQREAAKKTKPLPAICFSRKIGVGALEIADLLAEKINYDVVDRELLEWIADDEKISRKTVAFFDERYPDIIEDFIKMLYSEKSFNRDRYSQQLFRSVVALAGLSPTIFVGRGAHLILPRDRVLAVRFICSDDYRIERISRIMKITKDEAKSIIEKTDKAQKTFFKKVFGKKDAVAYEFDMVLNCDHICRPKDAADIVACAFKRKFPQQGRK